MATDSVIPYGCCHCGCGGKTPPYTRTQHHLGTIKGAPCRFLVGHQSALPPERLWDRVDKNGPTPAHRPELGPCWLWLGSINKMTGYGKFRKDGRFKSAHVAAYELEVGPMLQGMQIDHLCRVHQCVRPSHLEQVTPKENYLRGNGVPALNARKTHCKRGHEFTPDNTQVRQDGSRHCRICLRAEHHRKQDKRNAAQRTRRRRKREAQMAMTASA